MKTSVELAVSGIQALHLQRHRGRGGHRFKAKPSYVDESLFGSQVGRQTVVVEFDPPWVDNKTRPQWWSPEASRCCNSSSETPTPSSTPRKKNKYRLKNHMPSYCDETLFGPKPSGQEWATPWMMKEDIAKLRPLLLTPPSAPRDRPVLSSRPKATPMRAVHRELLQSQGTERSGAKYGQVVSFRKPPESNSDLDNQGWARSQSLTRLHGSSDRFRLAASKPQSSRQEDCRVPVMSTGSLSRPCSKGVSELSSSRIQKSTSSCKPRPPWK